MPLLRHIPNALTCGNLICGCLGLIEVLAHNLSPALGGVYIGIAAVLDFLDGFAARLLKVSSPIGKELDSLADVVTFGVLPAAMWFKILQIWAEVPEHWALVAFFIAVFSALRLAKFNVDTRQTDQFIGLPTPANALLIAALTFVLESFDQNPLSLWIVRAFTNPYVAVGFVGLMCYLLVAEIPLLAFKFKSVAWRGNEARFILLGLSGVLLILLKFAAVPILVFLYVVVSLVVNRRKSTLPHS